MANASPLKLTVRQGGAGAGVDTTPPSQRAIELSKRALETTSLDELLFLLTNDTRTVVEFDRSWVISHLSGASRLTATNNQPGLNGKSAYVEQLNRLAGLLRDYDKSLLISDRILTEDTLGNKVSADLKEALKSYIAFAKMTHLLILPLVHRDATVGHLGFEFAEGRIPPEADILAVLHVTPFLSAAMAEQSLLEQKPDLVACLRPQATGRKGLSQKARRSLPLALVAVIGVAILFFVIPFSFPVGGEAEIVPRTSHLAFCCVDGVIEEVFVREGERVKKDQLLAQLDPKELDYQITSWKSQYDILTQEMNRLGMESGDHPAKLAERKVAELKREGARNELQYLDWKKGFLGLRAPVSGIVATKDVQTLAGKRLNHGEPFCEIAVPEELEAQVYVPEDRISRVSLGQETHLYLNSDPTKGYKLKLSEVSPAAEVRPRLGSVYRAKAPFPDFPKAFKVGMKGIGKIDTGSASLWSIVTSQLRIRWNQFCLHF